MKTIAIVLAVFAVLGAAVYYAVGGGQAGGSELGQGVPKDATIVPIGELTRNAEAYKDKEVVIRGKLVEVCPTTGCWGVVKDETGSIRYDSAASGWALPPGQGGRMITVRGRVSLTPEGTPELAGIGAVL